MNAERLKIKFSLVLVAVGQIVAYLNYTDKMGRVLPGTRLRIGKLRSRFPIDFNPPPIMFVISFAFHIQYIALGLVVLYRMAGRMKMFGNGFHVHAISFGLMSSLYVVFYGFETISMAAITTGIFTLNALAMFVIALRRRVSPEKGLQPLPKSFEWWYDTMVINSYPPFIAWYTHSTCWVGTVALSYVDRPGEIAFERGWCGIHTSGSVLLLIMLALVILWVALDLYFIPNYTRRVTTMHPKMVLIGMAVYIYNYILGHGKNFNCLIYLAIAVIAGTGWFLRGRFHSKLPPTKCD